MLPKSRFERRIPLSSRNCLAKPSTDQRCPSFGRRTFVPEMPDGRSVSVYRTVLARLVSAVADTSEVFPQRVLKLIRKILNKAQGVLIV
jgi:hypothetical protein